jgi:manganese/zinc/iron transport system permease protein
MLQEFFALFSDHTVRVVAAGSTIIGFVAGALGSFAYLRRQSLLGDVVSHSSLSGITLALRAR